MSSTAKLFSSPGFGHIDPSVERGQLRKEIDAAMSRVDKLLKNSNICLLYTSPSPRDS